jgi:hypothetical protein
MGLRMDGVSQPKCGSALAPGRSLIRGSPRSGILARVKSSAQRRRRTRLTGTALGVAGTLAAVLFVAGGLLYTAGALVYARQRPDPRPATFGYHEIFHVLVIAAAVAHFAAIALYALPAGSG